MSKESFVAVLGLIVLLTPFLGIPRDYKEWVLGISGGVLILLGYQLRRHRFLTSFTKEGERKTDAFAENDLTPRNAHQEEQTNSLAL